VVVTLLERARSNDELLLHLGSFCLACLPPAGVIKVQEDDSKVRDDFGLARVAVDEAELHIDLLVAQQVDDAELAVEPVA
jgi:hypothetical protein